jgi:hypothetical protein
MTKTVSKRTHSAFLENTELGVISVDSKLDCGEWCGERESNPHVLSDNGF